MAYYETANSDGLGSITTTSKPVSFDPSIGTFSVYSNTPDDQRTISIQYIVCHTLENIGGVCYIDQSFTITIVSSFSLN